MGFVFISYSRQDTKTVDIIVSRLKSDGFEVWLDRASIKGGDLWTVAIVEAIDTADSFVLMLSPNSTGSDNVRKEVQLAQDAKRKIFPLLLAAVTLPAQFRYQLAGVQIIDYAGNPETKYRELVEVLQVNRERLSTEAKRPETRQVEVVLGEKRVESFRAPKAEKLLNFLANITGAPRSKFEITKVEAGSVHAFVNMPAHAAYVLKTAALNQDKRLLKHGVEAIRLDGQENYIHVGSGEIGPLDLLRKGPSLVKRILLTFIGIGLTAAIAFALLPKVPPMEPPPIKKPTTERPLATKTFTPTPTLTPTATKTPSPTATPQIPPSIPEVINPLEGGIVYCDGNPVFLDWGEAYDESGIASYEVELDVENKRWTSVFILPVDGQSTELEITNDVIKNCSHRLRWRVRAQDVESSWSDWSPQPVFWAENPPPPAPVIDVDPKLPNGHVSCYSSPTLFWNEPYDVNGISSYQLVIAIYNDGSQQWDNVFDEIVKSTSFDISRIVPKACQRWMSAQVIAQDNLGAWGLWSQSIMFYIELPAPQ